MTFTTTDSIRKDKKLGNIPRRTLAHKGEDIAIFEGGDFDTQVLLYIQTYGYLAEWTRQKYVQGHYVNWTDDMAVPLPKWAGDYELKPQNYRKVLRHRGWTVKIFETESGRDWGFPYEYRLIRGTQVIHSRTFYISIETCIRNARQDVDAQS